MSVCSKVRTRIHNSVVHVLVKHARAAGLQVHVPKTKTDYDVTPDFIVFNYASGKQAYCDVTIADPEASVYVDSSCTTPLYAAKVREDAKRIKYAGTFDADTCIFVPLAFESGGARGPSMQRYFKTIGELAQDNTGQPKQRFNTLWRRTVAVRQSIATRVEAYRRYFALTETAPPGSGAPPVHELAMDYYDC